MLIFLFIFFQHSIQACKKLLYKSEQISCKWDNDSHKDERMQIVYFDNLHNCT